MLKEYVEFFKSLDQQSQIIAGAVSAVLILLTLGKYLRVAHFLLAKFFIFSYI